MATNNTYTNIKDILKQFEIQIVQKKHYKKDEVYTKQEVNSALALKADKATTYTKTEVDGKLDLKADKANTYTKTQVDSALATKADRDATDSRFRLVESAIDDLTSVQNVVEVVATYSALQSYNTSNLDVNDKIQVIADETHEGASTIYNWDSTEWQYVGAFGGNSYTKAETYNKTQIDSALFKKADTVNIYSKSQVDNLLDGKVNYSDTYTREVIDNFIFNLEVNKADKSTTYTKTEIDGKLEEIGPMFEIVEKELEKKSSVIANPTLSGDEATLNGLEVDGTKYKIGGGSVANNVDDVVTGGTVYTYITTNCQPKDADLTAIAALTGTSGFLKKTAADTWALDTSTYLTTSDAVDTYLSLTAAGNTYAQRTEAIRHINFDSTKGLRYQTVEDFGNVSNQAFTTVATIADLKSALLSISDDDFTAILNAV